MCSELHCPARAWETLRNCDPAYLVESPDADSGVHSEQKDRRASNLYGPFSLQSLRRLAVQHVQPYLSFCAGTKES